MPSDTAARASSRPSAFASHPDSQATSASTLEPQDALAAPPGKKKRHRAKKRRNRKPSFAAPPGSLREGEEMAPAARPGLVDATSRPSMRSDFFNLRRTPSSTSLDSENLFDHRDQVPLPPRRQSAQTAVFAPRSHASFRNSPSRVSIRDSMSRSGRPSGSAHNSDDEHETNDRTPLIMTAHNSASVEQYGTTVRSPSGVSSLRGAVPSLNDRANRHPSYQADIDYDINNPPSRPPSPMLHSCSAYDDVMLPPDFDSRSSHDTSPVHRTGDSLINIDPEPSSARADDELGLQLTACRPTDDVCFPHDVMSDLGQEDLSQRHGADSRARRRRSRRWPDLRVLEDWSLREKEDRWMEEPRARKVSEPLLVGGRLRPPNRIWRGSADDAPYRFTYFNEEFQSTIHSHTISELLQDNQTFRDLFVPEPPVLESEDDDDDSSVPDRGNRPEEQPCASTNGHSAPPMARRISRLSPVKSCDTLTRDSSTVGDTAHLGKEKRLGPRPAFWLDILSPTETEMRVVSKAFGIHPLTSEDIMMQEAREKVEIFRNYYFVNYRTFEQDGSSERYMEPVNIYMVVFREGIISFHFSLTPHPANVRRRIRQLSDYLILSPDWISYAIIDDITDVYAPLIQRIEDEVDDIDDGILQLHSIDDDTKPKKGKKGDAQGDLEKPAEEPARPAPSDTNMLRRVGECRKKVMSLYRLLGNKADVIKGFAKRCNEQWDIAPRTEIGLYLGDIQDHIVTMTANLSHYENLLSRAHSNYLAQINMRMNERQEKTSDILGKLTVMGTIVLPMNVVTGIWGMNCLVPGQDVTNLNWFFGISGGLVLFGLTCYFIAKKIYRIV